jgi:DNA-binding winged helix-turn-helix (wHTH) protein
MKLVFGEFELDPATAELRQGSDLVSMERQAFDLLLLLADNAERVVSKDEIVEKIWDGRFISDSSISTERPSRLSRQSTDVASDLSRS